MTETRYFAVDAEGTRWTLAAQTEGDAFAEVEGTYYLRKIAKSIERRTTTTVWRFQNA